MDTRAVGEAGNGGDNLGPRETRAPRESHSPAQGSEDDGWRCRMLIGVFFFVFLPAFFVTLAFHFLVRGAFYFCKEPNRAWLAHLLMALH